MVKDSESKAKWLVHREHSMPVGADHTASNSIDAKAEDVSSRNSTGACVWSAHDANAPKVKNKTDIAHLAMGARSAQKLSSWSGYLTRFEQSRGDAASMTRRR